MKKTTLIFGLTALIASCSQSTKQQDSKANSTEAAVEANEVKTGEPNTAGKFNIEDITFSTADMGDFPFINLTEGLKSMKKMLDRIVDVCLCPMICIMSPFEGRLYKIYVTNERDVEYSKRFFEISIDDYLLS